MNLLKPQKILVFFSVVWSIICLLSASDFSESSYSGAKNYTKFAASFFIISAPVWLYWAGVWIWGFGYLKNAIKRIMKSFMFAQNETVDKHGVLNSWEKSPHPWLRYWARMVDYSIFALVIAYIFLYLLPSALLALSTSTFDTLTNPIVFNMLTIILWIPLESLFLSTLGTTPGKAILNISVINFNGTKLSYPQAFLRSLTTAVKGMALGIPLFSMIRLVVSYGYLKTNNTTLWDKSGSHKLIHNEIKNLFRWCLVILVLAAPFLCFYYLPSTSDRKIEKVVDNKASEELINSYKKIANPSVFLSPDNLSNSALIQQNIQKLKTIKSLIPDYEAKLFFLVKKNEEAVLNLDITPMHKNFAIKNIGVERPMLLAFFNAEIQKLNFTEELLIFMNGIQGAYLVINGQLSFKFQEHLDFFNIQVKKIKDIELQRDANIRLLMMK